MKKLMLLAALSGLAACHAEDLVAVHATVTTNSYIAFQYTAAPGVPQPPHRLRATARRHCRALNKRADESAAAVADFIASRAPFWTVTFPCVT